MIPTLLFPSSLKPSLPLVITAFPSQRHGKTLESSYQVLKRATKCRLLGLCKAQKNANPPSKSQVFDGDSSRRRGKQFVLWALEGVYVCWLFLLPYAPGDPVWAIKSDTIKELVDLSLNFFFILPIINSGFFESLSMCKVLRAAGIHAIDAPVLHPAEEALFNFVIGWTLMFAPLLFTDRRRDRFKGSLELLWAVQMFLTNTLLIPYMAIRLGDMDEEYVPKKPSSLVLALTTGAPVIGIFGGVVGLVSVLWAFIGRGDGGFGMVADRWEYFRRYVGSDRLAYAFLWDICLYAIFQPWLIGDNLKNVQENRVGLVRNLRFIPFVGLVVYLLSFNSDAKS